MADPKERLAATLNAATVFFLLLAVLLRPLVCGISGGLATNILVTMPLLAAAFLWIVGMAVREEVRLRRTPLDLPILFLLLFAVASVGTAAYKYAAAAVVFDWVCYVVLFYLVVNLCAQRPRLADMLLAAALASTFVVSLNGVFQHFYSLEATRDLFLKNQQSWIVTLGLSPDAASDFVGRLSTGRVFSTFLLPNTCAGFLGVMIPLQVALLAGAWRGGRRAAFVAANGAALFCSLLCLYYTKSKGGWITLGIVTFVFLAMSGRRIVARHWAWVAGGGAAVILLFAVLQLMGFAPPVREYFESFTVRAQYWRAGAQIVERHPWFGVGLNNFGDYFPEFHRPMEEETQMAHNNFLQVWAETGVFGLLAFCSVWVMFFRGMKGEDGPEAARDAPGGAPPGSPYALGALACVVGFATIYTMFSSFEPIPRSAPWLLTACLGVAWLAVYSLAALQFDEKPGFLRKPGFLLGVLFFLIHSLVEFDLYEPGLAQTVWLLMGIGLASRARGEARFKLGSAGQLAVALPVTALVGFLLCGVYPRILEAKIRRENARELLATKENRKALVEWLVAARLDPWEAETRMALAEMFYLEWREGTKEYEGVSPFELALRHVRRAIELNPRRARYHHFLARLCYEMSGEEKSPAAADELRRLACAEYAQAHKLFPTRSPYAADLAFAYDALGRRQEAQTLYAKALELDDQSRPERYLAKLSPETRRELEARLAKRKP